MINKKYFKQSLVMLATILSLLVSMFYPLQVGAAIYFDVDAENGIVGNNLSNPPFCRTACGGSSGYNNGVGIYESSGGTPQGSKFFQWQTNDNQNNYYTEVKDGGFPVTNILGDTIYLAWFFRFDRIGGLNIWHTTGNASGDKGIEIRGSGVRWETGNGFWGSGTTIPDNRYTVWLGNPTYHLNSEVEIYDIYRQNQNGYSAANSIPLQYEQWYSAVMAVKMATDNTGSVAVYIDGVKVLEYLNIKTAANSNPTIDYITIGGTIAQPAYDAPAHIRKKDAFLLTDNWQDIIDGGYLISIPTDTTPPSAPTGLVVE